jgi:hypothetical protein
MTRSWPQSAFRPTYGTRPKTGFGKFRRVMPVTTAMLPLVRLLDGSQGISDTVAVRAGIADD